MSSSGREWKRIKKKIERRGPQEASQELENKLQHMQEKFQIMRMQKVEYNQKLKVENQKL
jgi:hypothetical protein